MGTYIAYGLTILNSIADEMKNLKGAPQFDLIEKKLLAYEGVMELIAECVRLKRQLFGEETESRLREYGKDIADRANGLVKFECEQILIILKTLESYLLFSLLIFFGMVFFLITTVSRKIISPLKINAGSFSESDDECGSGDSDIAGAYQNFSRSRRIQRLRHYHRGR
jgi:hypothetical protein